MVLVTLLWATAGVVSRQLHSAHGFEVTFWRSAFTVLALTVALPWLKGRQVFANVRHAGWHFWLSGVCWSVMFTAFMLALTMASVGNVLVTMSIGPLLTAVLARIFIGHRLPVRTVVAIAAAGAGIAYMYASQIQRISLAGTVIALCVPLAGAINWTVTQHAHSHSHGDDVDLMTAVWVGAVISSLLTITFALPFQATGFDWLWLSFLGLFQLAIPCVLSVRCAQVLAAPEMSLLQLMEIIFGILLAWLGASEVPDHAVLVGGCVVLGALICNETLAQRLR
ncbi:DMT family transporter [Curvibacter sp. CHRR-16]|nr:DMT family transporter [Curvibacter sp. CHRR-16]